MAGQPARELLHLVPLCREACDQYRDGGIQIMPLTAEEQVDRRIAMFGPAMDADVRFGEQRDCGNPLAGAEAVQPEVDQRRARSGHGVAQHALDARRVIEPGAVEQIDQKMVAGERHSRS